MISKLKTILAGRYYYYLYLIDEEIGNPENLINDPGHTTKLQSSDFNTEVNVYRVQVLLHF